MCVFPEFTPVTAGKSQCSIYSLDTNTANSNPVFCSSSRILFLEHVGRQVASQLLGVTPDNTMLSLI